MNVRITPLTTEFFDSFYTCFSSVVLEKKYLSMSTPFPYEATIEFLRLSRDRGIPFLLLLDGENVVGWADLQPDDKNKIVGNLGVGIAADYREQGAGTALLCALFAAGKIFGYKTLALRVRVSNSRAIHVYEKLGFVKIRRVNNGVTTDNVCEDIFVMEKIL